jgi:hypothetical protein
MKEETLTLAAMKKWSPEKIAKAVAEIDAWSSNEMKERMKDDDTAEQVEWLLSQPIVKADAPKPQPKPKPKPPVRSTEEQIIESMSADQFKHALTNPARARGIERILSRGQQ